MKKNFPRQFRAFAFLLVLLVFVQGCTSTSSKEQETFTLTIAHLNDTHANLEPSTLKLSFDGTVTYTTVGGFPAVTAKVKQLRQRTPNFLFLHAGDVFQGNLYFIKYLGMADLAFLKLMKLDAMCAGNHEFDKGPRALAKFIDETQNQFPVLSANISTEKEPLLAAQSGKLKPYVIKKFGSRQVGIIGITTIETPDVSSPGKLLVFNDPLETVNKMVTELTEKGINIIIVLSHQGIEQDIQLAKAAGGVDLVVGGHTHTLTGRWKNVPELSPEADYPYVVRNSRQETVLVVQAWEKAKILGKLAVDFDSAGKVVGYSGHPILLTGNKPGDFKQKNTAGEKVPVNSETFNTIAAFIGKSADIEMVEEDKEARALLDKFAGPILELKRTVIGKSEVNLWHVRQPGDVHETAGVLPGGSLIAPVVADALLWKAKTLKDKNTQIVIQNAGSVRTDIPKGDVTIGQVYELLPFGNTLVLFDIDGARLKEVLKSAIDNKDGAFPYAAGLRYKMDGGLLTSIDVQSGGKWIPLQENETYHLAVNNFIAIGKDGYTAFDKIKEKYDTGFVVADIFMEYLKKTKTLPPPENRVNIVGSRE